MMRFTVLASGSKGNATVVEAEGRRILIDCGLSYRELTKRLDIVGLKPTDLDALLITHLHSDHIRGVSSVLDKVPLKVFARQEFYGIPLGIKSYKLRAYEEFELDALKITALPLPHDDGGSFGFVVNSNSTRLVFATDLGFPTDELALALKSADATVIESNHCLKMLDECSYPHFIKERIRSEYGHLSNCQSADLLSRFLFKQCQHVVLAHLSEKANHPAQAMATMHHAINKKVSVASQTVPTEWFNIFKSSSELALAPSLA